MRVWPRHIPRSRCFVGAVEMAVTCAELVLGVRLGGYGRTPRTLRRGRQRGPWRAWSASAPASPSGRELLRAWLQKPHSRDRHRYLSPRDQRPGDGAHRHQGGMSDPTALLSAIDTGGGKDGPKRASVLHHEGLDRKRYAARPLASIPSKHRGFASSPYASSLASGGREADEGTEWGSGDLGQERKALLSAGLGFSASGTTVAVGPHRRRSTLRRTRLVYR